jgi:general secretion pathway protein G
MLLMVALLLSTIGPAYFHLQDEAKSEDTKEEIEVLAIEIDEFFITNGFYPDSLDQVFSPVPVDPWGQPYQYLRISGGTTPGLQGKRRKDKNLVPINSDYDFYSLGPDGDSLPPLTANASKDDIVRANNGSYFGVAEEY